MFEKKNYEDEKERKDMIGVLVIRVPLRSYPIDSTRSDGVFLEKNDKKRISISPDF